MIASENKEEESAFIAMNETADNPTFTDEEEKIEERRTIKEAVVIGYPSDEVGLDYDGKKVLSFKILW